ncbi:hypothetical protein LX32DRAFT_256907 [Colletotrichum zoysiae]|uniref:Uncharacterized protein n=1 Tax=Colletotrichum zoysiae TaxID=1216348 RepID=A0AAD9HNU9_9PEZI|nr:hypothetical protein LX32DRAFT_256907 [Colletotrichum zoysiae]
MPCHARFSLCKFGNVSCNSQPVAALARHRVRHYSATLTQGNGAQRAGGRTGGPTKSPKSSRASGGGGGFPGLPSQFRFLSASQPSPAQPACTTTTTTTNTISFSLPHSCLFVHLPVPPHLLLLLLLQSRYLGFGMVEPPPSQIRDQEQDSRNSYRYGYSGCESLHPPKPASRQPPPLLTRTRLPVRPSPSSQRRRELWSQSARGPATKEKKAGVLYEESKQEDGNRRTSGGGGEKKKKKKKRKMENPS